MSETVTDCNSFETITWWCSTGPYYSAAYWSSSCQQCQRCEEAFLQSSYWNKGGCGLQYRWATAGRGSLPPGLTLCMSEKPKIIRLFSFVSARKLLVLLVFLNLWACVDIFDELLDVKNIYLYDIYIYIIIIFTWTQLGMWQALCFIIITVIDYILCSTFCGL